MQPKEKRPLIGIGVIALRDGKVLLGKRIGSHGKNTWSFPGGHLEFGESVETCAAREIKEEADLDIQTVERAPYTNDIFAEENKHYITLFVITRDPLGEPKIMEPNKCLEWQWFDWNNFPSPLFLPIENLKKNYPNFNPIQTMRIHE